jgi:hypothetical protein
MTQPNFLIIGAPKCGTTALYAVLARHPQIYMSQRKEPFFFAFENLPPDFTDPGGEPFRRHAVTDWESYQTLFAGAASHSAVGEASALYLTHFHPERTAENIRRRLPEVRLIAVLRQPADRAYSHFTYNRQRGYEPLHDFRQALAAEEQRIAANWAPPCRYRRDGWYCHNLRPYFERFPRSQIRIYLYDDWKTQPQTLLSDLCTFLQIDPALMPAQIEHKNVTTWQRSGFVTYLQRRARVHKALMPRWLLRWVSPRLNAWNRVAPPALDPHLRRELTESYREEILDLQTLIGQDLSRWLAAPAHGKAKGP